MSQWIKILLTGGIILLIQMIVFRDNLSPILWGKLKISGLACTCPDETVDKGRFYLRFITPDSLKKYHLDYSEIYVTEMPSTEIDPMGVDQYIITGSVIGKDRVSDNDPWNPKIRIDKWRPINMIFDYLIKGLFVGQLLILGWIVIKIKNKNNA